MSRSIKRVSVLRRSSMGIIALTLVSHVAEATTKTIGKLESGSLRVLVVESESGLSFAVNSSSDLRTEDAKVSFAKNPERVILDLPAQAKLHDTKTLTLSHRLIRSLRIGSHPEKTRVVLDLAERQPTSHSLSVVEPVGALLLHLSFVQSPAKPLQNRKVETRRPVPQTAPVPRSTVPELVEKSTSHVDNLAHSQQKREIITATTSQGVSTEMVPVVRGRLDQTGAFLNSRGVIVHRGETQEEAETQKVPRSAQLRSLQFVTGKPKELDSLVATIDNIQGFTLTPTAADEYEFRLRDTEIAADFPTRLGLGFVAIESEDEAPDSVLRIKVSPGVALAAELTSDTIALRATRN